MRRTLQRFTALLAFALLCFVTAAAEDITVDNLKFTLNATDHTASVSGVVDKSITTADIPQTVTSADVEYKVTSVATDCFYKCSSLTSVTLPEGITSIGQYSFSKCNSLTSITIPEGVTSLGRYCFAESKRLSSVSLPKSLTSLGEDCFYYCSRLKSITIPEGVTKLEAQCFSMCLNLTSLTLPHSITSIGNDCFNSVGNNMPCYLYIDDEFDTKLLGTAGESSYSISGGTLIVPVQSIKLSSNELDVALGGSFDQVKATVVPAAANNRKISISSDNTSVVSIENGDSIVVKGLGETDIRYKAADRSGVSAVCHVTVCPPADSVRTDVSQKELFAGQTFRPVVTIHPAGAVQQFKASSSDPQVATVDSAGTVTAVGPGEADIRYEAKDGTGKYAVCHVKVWALTGSITLSDTTLTLKMGEEYDKQTVQVLPSGACPKVKMTSQDGSVATVDENGVIKAVGLGVTNIVYQAMDGSRVEAKCRVRVILQDSDYYAINSKETWEKFCALIDGGYTTISAKMTDDVTLDSISPMAGAKQAFAGRFDGQGHTLTVNYIGTGQATAPFNVVQGAVIENLRTAGTIRQTGTTKPNPQSHASGLVGAAYGVTINNCEVAVAISYTLTGDHHSGGFIGHGEGKVITMNNCKFSGSFNGPEGGQISGIAGLVGWSAGSGSSFTNCYVAGSYSNIVDVHPLVYTSDNITVSSANNYYYFNGIGASVWRTKGTATAVTADSVESGNVTWRLERGAGAKGWSQYLPDETEPMLAYSDAQTVNRVEFVYNDTIKFVRYANTGSTLPDGVPALTAAAKGIVGSGYNESYYYETTYTPAFTDNTVVTADSIIKMDLKSSEYLTVNSKETWEQFCKLVNGGSSKLNAKMTADVTDAVYTMAGGSSHTPYQGTFDGQGHTLTLDIFQFMGDGAAPFSYINGATIKGLRTAGKITTYSKNAGGIVGVVKDSLSTVSNCQSDVTIYSSVEGDASHGGIVGLANGPVSIDNCAFTGVISGSSSYNCGGILGWAGATGNTIRNCLVTGKLEINTSASGDSSDPIARNSANVNVSTTYYLNTPHATSNGEQITEEKLKNGFVAYKLQEWQQQFFWAYRLGAGTMLYAFSHPDENDPDAYTNYVYYDAWKWRCKYYQQTDSVPYENSYVDFTADRITYHMSFKQGRYYTWFQPFTLTYSAELPFKAYWFTSSSNGNVVFKEISYNDALLSFTPYIIVMKEDMDRFDYDQSAPVMSCPSSLGYMQRGDIRLTGTVKGLDNTAAAAAAAYILQDDNIWHKVTTDNTAATIPPYRAYLTMAAPASAKTITMVIGDETTGISGVVGGHSRSGAVYNLQGQKVADSLTDDVRRQLPAGIYIVNGKKYNFNTTK